MVKNPTARMVPVCGLQVPCSLSLLACLSLTSCSSVSSLCNFALNSTCAGLADTTNGNGSSNCSYSNGHGNNGSSGSGGEGGSGGGHSNKGSNSNEGSDHGFFDTAGEDGGNFSDELDGTGAGSDMFSSCSFTGV